MRRLAVILLCLLIPLSVFSSTPTPEEKLIEGTALSGLNNAYEVLQRLSSLTDDGASFSIAGQGVANIYVDERRLTRHTDLMMIPASSVHSVEVLSEARPEYGNSKNVILITLKEVRTDEFDLVDVAEVVSAPMISGSNELEISGRKRKFLYDAVLALSYLGTRDDETRTENQYSTIPGSSHFSRDSRVVKEFADVNREYAMNVKADLGYEFNAGNKVSAGYEYDYNRQMTQWENMHCTEYVRKGDDMDVHGFPAESSSVLHTHRHSLHLGYSGNSDDWKIVANLDLYTGREKEDYQDFETRMQRESVLDEKREFNITESYFRMNVSHPLWKGNVRFGIMMDDMIQDSFKEDIVTEEDRVHAKVYSAIPGAFVSVTQDFGVLSMDAGLQYHLHVYRYTPYDDDMTRQRIIDLIGSDRIKNTENIFHPHLKLSFHAGESTFSAGYQSMTDFPPVSALLLQKVHLETGDPLRALTLSSRRDEFFLKGDWKWLEIRGWSTQTGRPLFQDIDYVNDFNGPDHWSMDWRLTLSPSVAFWESGFTAELHKQWLEMELVDPADNLKAPRGLFNWNNSFSMPWGMNADVMTMVRTRGAQGNMFYREPSWKVDFAVRQKFLKGHLTLSFNVQNVFRKQCDSIAFYTRKQEKEFDFNERYLHRTFLLSLKYTL